MKMVHLLVSMVATVDYETITVVSNAFIVGEFLRHDHESPHRGLILSGDVVYRWNNLVGHQQYMGGGPRIVVAKSGNQLVLVNDVGRNIAIDDSAEKSFFGH